jgi:hypothetical protein
MSDASKSAPRAPRRRRSWRRFSLRCLLLFVTLFCVFAGWFGTKLREGERQRAVVARLSELGWKVEYDYEPDPDAARHRLILRWDQDEPRLPAGNDDSTAPGAKWLRDWLGRDVFDHVIAASQDTVQLGAPPPLISDTDFELLFAFPRLNWLVIPDSALTEASIARLTEFANLEYLGMDEGRLNDAWLAAIGRCQSLKELAIYQDSSFASPAGLEHLGELVNLKRLALPTQLPGHINSAVNDRVARRIAGLRKLKVLFLENSTMTDAGLKDLGNLDRLELLGLNGTPVTDRGLALLSNLKSLRELRLDGTKITDAGLRRCALADNLTSLSLNGTRITDAAVNCLMQFKHLRYLHLVNTALTEAAIKRLQQALPETNIVWEKP